MDNEFEYITSSHPEEPEPVPFRDKHPKSVLDRYCCRNRRRTRADAVDG